MWPCGTQINITFFALCQKLVSVMFLSPLQPGSLLKTIVGLRFGGLNQSSHLSDLVSYHRWVLEIILG